MRLLKVSDPEAEPIVNTILKNNPRTEDEEPVVETDDPDRRILVCTVTANPGQVQFAWSTLRRDNQNDTDSPASFPVAEETVVTWGEPVAGQTEGEGLGSASVNYSVVILKDNSDIRVATNNDGSRTYVCQVNNTVGADMCSMNVQGDVPWWKQLLVAIGLGGIGIQSGWIVVVALVLVIFVILALVIMLLILLCKRCRHRHGWRGNQNDEETGASSQNGSTGPKSFYENLPFHGMRPALSQFSNTTVTPPLTTTATADVPQKSKPPLPVVSPLLIHRPKANGYVSLLRQAVASLEDQDGGAKRFSSLQRPVRNKTGNQQQFRSMRVKSHAACPAAGGDPNNNDGDRDRPTDNRIKQATGGSILGGPVPAPRGLKRPEPSGGRETYENLLHLNNNQKPYTPGSYSGDASDLEYADVDYRSYGPINYKAASSS